MFEKTLLHYKHNQKNPKNNAKQKHNSTRNFQKTHSCYYNNQRRRKTLNQMVIMHEQLWYKARFGLLAISGKSLTFPGNLSNTCRLTEETLS
jgi:hypothetical protein